MLDNEELNERLEDNSWVQDAMRIVNGKDNLIKWFELLDFIKDETCNEDCDYCNVNERLDEEPLLVYADLICALDHAGVKFPEVFPKELDFNYEENDNPDDKEEPDIYSNEIIEENVFGRLFYQFFTVYGQYNSFKVEFMDPILDDTEGKDEEWEDFYGKYLEFDEYLIELSLIYLIKDEKKFAPKLYKLKERVFHNIKENIYQLKRFAYEHKIPLEAELIDLLNREPGYLDNLAEGHGMINKYYGPMDYYVKLLIEKVGYLEDLVEGLNKKLDKLSKE